MDGKEKRLLLIKELTDFTKQGALQWEKTSQQGTYMATFPNSAVRISTRLPNSGYSLHIIDAKGDVTESILGSDLVVSPVPSGTLSPNEAFRPLAALFQVVNQQVETQGDKTIDDVFAELARLSAQGMRAS